MENKKINIAEILKNCPPGMELDCTAYNNLYFDNIIDSLSSYPIKCYTTNNGMLTSVFFSKYGGIGNEESAKCVIFPKGKTTWEGFQGYFKDGDIVATRTKRYIWISIYKENRNGRVQTHADYNKKTSDFFIDFNGGNLYLCDEDEIICQRFATEEEKVKLFNKIKEHGYHWNEETKTLEKLIEPKFKVGDKIKNKISNKTFIITNKDSLSYYIDNSHFSIWIENQDNYELVLDKIEPKFKVGDVVQDKDGYKVEITEVNIDDECYVYMSKIANVIGSISFKDQDEWELVLVKIFVPKFKVGDRVKSVYNNNQYIITCVSDTHYTLEEVEHKFKYYEPIIDEETWELVPNKFDISTLEPFESRVLVRDFEDQAWKPAIWGYYDINSCNRSLYILYRVLGGNGFLTCIPYEGNEHLRGKTDDCDNYYKTWED